MNQFKRAKVVLLPTKNNHFQLEIDDLNTNKLSFELKQYVCKNPQHLYIISDDEIKEGDWFILNNEIKQLNKIRYSGAILTLKNGDSIIYGHNFKYAKKIIATTDTSLNYIEHDDTVPYPKGVQIRLPQPSQQFITKYIEDYNKGNVITDVLVEYSPSSITLQTYSNQQIDDNLKALSLKVNPKDNTITIKKLKDNYTLEEIYKLMNDYQDYLFKTNQPVKTFKEWFNS